MSTLTKQEHEIVAATLRAHGYKHGAADYDRRSLTMARSDGARHSPSASAPATAVRDAQVARAKALRWSASAPRADGSILLSRGGETKTITASGALTSGGARPASSLARSSAGVTQKGRAALANRIACAKALGFSVLKGERSDAALLRRGDEVIALAATSTGNLISRKTDNVVEAASWMQRYDAGMAIIRTKDRDGVIEQKEAAKLAADAKNEGFKIEWTGRATWKGTRVDKVIVFEGGEVVETEE